MSTYTHRGNFLLAALIVLPLAVPITGQSRRLVDEDWYGDVKKILTDHYTGRMVRLKLPIPATRRGLEMVDGSLQREASKTTPQFSAKVGETLTIKSFKVEDSSVEVLLDKDEPPRKNRLVKMFTGPNSPRINLRFSHELSSKDLTIENLNRFLSLAVDVKTLASPIAENNSTATATATAAPNQQPEIQPNRNPELGPTEQSSPTPNIVADLPTAGPSVGELTIECSVRGARIYIDGSYSGVAPRTLRLRAGLHTILVVGDGYENWERRLFIPGAKISVARADLRRWKG